MNLKITRRDFLNGALLGAGALLLDLPAPLQFFAQTRQDAGFGGVGDYASSNGNTPEVIRAFQSIERGDFASVRDIDDTGELYDLVVAEA